ncbi:MAG: radical SAM protein [Fibrobacteres bacterium]|jgi:radical SAM superfamily enzyme YgiQ (UPF0313 family)|nr:radical SAM protein [Fibrobacterota bacterium]
MSLPKKKVLLIQPSIYDDRGGLLKKRRLQFVGLAYPLLAAMSPPDWEIELCLETIEEIPWDTDAPVVGIGGMGHAMNRGKDIALEFKKRGKTVILGGPMASLAPELVEPFCDAVVVGDAENVWLDVLADLENGTLKPRYHVPLQHLSTPLPRYELVTGKRIGQFLPVQAGRGCPNACSFCSIFCLYRTRYFQRPIPEVIRDITRVKELGFKQFLLLDDNIASDRQYMLDLCRAIEPLGMTWLSQCEITVAKDDELLAALTSSGCTMLSFGLESIQPESLAALNKKWCKPDEYRELLIKVADAGIDVASEMIVGVETDTLESLRRTVEWVASTPIAAPKFYLLTPIPGTDLYERYKREGRILDPNVFTYTASHAVISHPNMTTRELNDIFWEIYDRLYTLPRILRRTVLHRRFWRKPGHFLFLLGVNLYYRWQIKKRIAPIVM